jgi:predicted nucleic acid-binding protein
MLYLVDTGVLLRLFNKADPDSMAIRNALLKLKREGHRFVVSTQNVAEFWNVCTRPASARGGFDDFSCGNAFTHAEHDGFFEVQRNHQDFTCRSVANMNSE